MVNGDWGQWTVFTQCTKSCEGGQKYRTRICDSPSSKNGGLDCLVSGSLDRRAIIERDAQTCNDFGCRGM